MLYRLGSWVVKFRVLVIIVWIACLFPALYGVLHLHEVLRGEAAPAPGGEMYQQEILLNEHFPEQDLYNIQLVISSEDHTVDDPVYQDLLARYDEIIQADEGAAPAISYVQDPEQLSSDRKSTFLYIGLHARDMNGADEAARILSDKLRAVERPPGFEIHLTGGPLFSHEITTVSAKDAFHTEERVLPLVLIILVLAFGGLLAAFMPLVVGVFSTLVSLGLLYMFAHYIPLTSLSQNMITMLGLGVGIDYSLLFVNRFREEMRVNGLDKDSAAIRTLESSGRTILYSGTVVSIGLMALLVPNVVFMRSLGLSGLLVVGMTVLVGLTLMPALLSVLGNHIDAPKKFSDWAAKRWGESQFWYRWAKYIMSRPLFFSLVSIGALISLSILTLDMKVWNPTIEIMPESFETRQGYAEILEISPRYKFSPIVFTFESRDGSPIWSEENIGAVHEFMQIIKRQEPIEGSIGLVNANQDLASQMVLYNTIAASGGVQTLKLFQPGLSLPFISADETKGALIAFHEYEGYGLQDGSADIDTIQSIREYRDRVAGRYPNLKILTGSLSAVPLEIREAIFNYFPLIVLVTVVATYVLTMFSFGSVLLPLKAVILNILSVTATYGAMILVFQMGIGASLLQIEQVPGALMIVSPLILFCVIFGLSMDYEIFLINRIREEYDKCGDPEEAIALGMEKTGGIITNAGLIMILVFMGFAFARIIVIKEFGFGLAVAIFLDATIIRLMVVPSLMRLFGHASWYFPKFLDIPLLRNALKE